MATKSEGYCRFCMKSFPGSSMSRHLASCPAKKERDAQEAAAAKGKSSIYHLKITGSSWYHDAPYWLHLEVNDAVTLSQLDSFLRNIWLECCGHLSEFNIHGIRYSDSPEDDFWDAELESEPTDIQLKKVLDVKDRFEYTYDFGSSTDLLGEVMGKRPGKLTGEKIRILARNNPPDLKCVSCGKAAEEFCGDCQSFYCEKCLKKHECGDEMALPVVNSPRTGVCGFSGEFDTDFFMEERAGNAAR